MGWADDHRNMVADRWAARFRESDMSPKLFIMIMKETMRKYGWSEIDIQNMVERALGKSYEANHEN